MQLKLLIKSLTERDVVSMENKIVVLDDGKQYCILNETTFKDKKYCCGVEYFEDKEDLGDDYFAGFWNSDSRGSQVMIFKTEKDKYFTFDDQKDIIINPTKDDILKKENK